MVANSFMNTAPGTLGVRRSSTKARTICAFVIGCMAPIPFKFVGVLYGGEVLLLIVAAWVFVSQVGKKAYWNNPMVIRFMAFLLIGLSGYIATDLIRETPPEDYLRGWSKIVFIFSNFTALYFLARKNSAAFISFFFAWELAAVVYFLVTPAHHNDFHARYKFELAGPLTIGILSLLALRRARSTWLAPLILGLLGVLHIVLDYRSLATICFLVSAMLLAAKRERGLLVINKRILLATVLGCSIVLGSLYTYYQSQYESRRGFSNTWRFGTTVATFKGIARSPIIGNGSWSTDEEMQGWRDDAMGVSRLWREMEPFTAHSQVLEGWYEGGILTEVFFLYYGFHLISAIKLLLRRPVDNFSALFCFVVFYGLWCYFFSPLNGPARLDLAATMVLLCYLQTERREAIIGAARAQAFQAQHAALGMQMPSWQARGYSTLR